MTKPTVWIGIQSAPGWMSWCVEWYDEDTDSIAHWYGDRLECEARAKKRPPKLHPREDNGYQPDAATLTGMYDR